MAKGLQTEGLAADVTELIEQLERHSLAPDGSMASKSAYYDLQLAREEMLRERLHYLEAMAIYREAIGMVEEYQKAVSVASLGGISDVHGFYPEFDLKISPQDGEIHEEEIEKCSVMSRSSLDSTSTSITINSSSNSANYTVSLTNSIAGVANNPLSLRSTDAAEPGVGGVPNCFLGVTPAYLWQTQLQQTAVTLEQSEYQMSLAHEIEARLKAKCNKLAEAFVINDNDSSFGSQISSALSERVKLLIEEIESEETALREDLYSADRKFAEFYNVMEQILTVLIKFVKDLKLQHQHQYDELRKTWLCRRCEAMNAKLRALEHIILCNTYTQDSTPALHMIRKYLLEATKEASIAYNKAVTCLREYQGVDPHFDTIARQYQDIVKKLEGMQWTIHQVEMDLNRSPEN